MASISPKRSLLSQILLYL